MRSLPSELSELVGPPHWRRLMRSSQLSAPRRVAWLPGAFPADRAAELIELLEHDLAPHLRPMRSTLPDPRESQSNYGEVLHKVMRNRTTILDNPRTNAYRAAEDRGRTRRPPTVNRRGVW